MKFENGYKEYKDIESIDWANVITPKGENLNVDGELMNFYMNLKEITEGIIRMYISQGLIIEKILNNMDKSQVVYYISVPEKNEVIGCDGSEISNKFNKMMVRMKFFGKSLKEYEDMLKNGQKEVVTKFRVRKGEIWRKEDRDKKSKGMLFDRAIVMRIMKKFKKEDARKVIEQIEEWTKWYESKGLGRELLRKIRDEGGNRNENNEEGVDDSEEFEFPEMSEEDMEKMEEIQEGMREIIEYIGLDFNKLVEYMEGEFEGD